MLKDFVHVAGPLGVTHFVIVSRTEQYINLKVCRLPRGPTLTFHINAVSKGLTLLLFPLCVYVCVMMYFVCVVFSLS